MVCSLHTIRCGIKHTTGHDSFSFHQQWHSFEPMGFSLCARSTSGVFFVPQIGKSAIVGYVSSHVLV